MVFCLECNQSLPKGVEDFSIRNFNIPLCIEHQNWIKWMTTQTTDETIRLYFALKKLGVPAKMEVCDGYKRVDIEITDAKVHIEVDGSHHNTDVEQARRDLKRTYHSFLNGFLTIRIPNSLVYNDFVLNETADYIVGLLNENLKNINQ